MPPIDTSIPGDGTEAFMILFRILSRRSWDELQEWHRAFPTSRIEQLISDTGFYMLIVEPGLGPEWERIS